MLEQCRAFLGQVYASCGAVQQLGLQQSFELPDMVAQWGLADAKSRRRPPKVAFFGNGDKIAKLFNIDHYSDFQINNK